jgi:hypothetical protein
MVTLKKLFPVIAIMLGILLLTSCLTIRDTQSSSHSGSREPLVTEWQMTRLSIKPSLPVPDIILNQVISDKATWKIGLQGSQFTIKYDGRDTWYKPIIGLPIDKKPVTVTPNQAKTSITFAGGGSINVDKLPLLLAALSTQKMEQISVGFDDKVQVTLASGNKINATIAVNANGKYYGETEFGGSMKWKTLAQSFTVTYEGTQK